jgi:tripeptidyl-peptidase-1
MTAEEVIDFFAPSDESVDAIIEWVTSAGIDRDRVSLSANKQWIQFDAPVEEVEDLLYADYFVWEHGASGSTDVACEEYHVPGHLREHVDYVMPGIRMMPNQSKRSAVVEVEKRATPVQHQGRASPTVWPGFPQVNSTSCHNYVTPSCIKSQSLACFRFLWGSRV